MSNNQMKEYDNLRNEINQKTELHNTLLTFTITATITALTFALSNERTSLYLIPFFIVIPMSIRIAYYRTAMAKLAAYMIVFLEGNLDGIKWETRNNTVIKDALDNKKKSMKNLTILQYYECLILSIICYIFYVIDYIKDKEISVEVVICALLPLLFVIWEASITKRINLADKEKEEWINRWTDLKLKEMANNSPDVVDSEI